MGKVILVTSCKGGVGKSTVSAYLAAKLAMQYSGKYTSDGKKLKYDELVGNQKKILVIDCDFDVRCLDLMLAGENEVIYDLSDILAGRATEEETARQVKGFDNLFFIPAPMAFDAETFPETAFVDYIKGALERYEYVVLDSAPAHSVSFYIAEKAADCAVVVTTSQSTALRAASKTAAELSALGMEDVRLLINMFKARNVLHNELPGIMKSVETSSSQLIGIVPYDERVQLCQEKGTFFDLDNRAGVGKAFDNTAKRVIGFNVSLPKKISGIRTKRLY